MTHLLDIRKTVSFPGALRLFGILLVALPLIPAISKWVSLPIATVGLGIATAYLGLRIDLKNKTRQEYVWLLGLRFGEAEPFQQIEYLFMKANNVSQNMSARLASATLHFQVFDGFLRFSEADKVHLFRTRDREALLAKMDLLGKQLAVDILDYTDR